MVTILDTQEDYQRAYERMLLGNRHQALLYSSDDPSFETFYALVKQGWALEYIYDIPVALTWLDTFNGTTAFQHFCFYEGQEQYINKVLIEGLDWAFSIGQRSTLFGLTPKVYRGALQHVAYRAGFEKILEEPNMCFMAKFNRYVPGILTRLSKSKWEQVRNTIRSEYEKH